MHLFIFFSRLFYIRKETSVRKRAAASCLYVVSQLLTVTQCCERRTDGRGPRLLHYVKLFVDLCAGLTDCWWCSVAVVFRWALRLSLAVKMCWADEAMSLYVASTRFLTVSSCVPMDASSYVCPKSYTSVEEGICENVVYYSWNCHGDLLVLSVGFVCFFKLYLGCETTILFFVGLFLLSFVQRDHSAPPVVSADVPLLPLVLSALKCVALSGMCRSSAHQHYRHLTLQILFEYTVKLRTCQ